MPDAETRTPALLITEKTNHFPGDQPVLNITLSAVYLTATGQVRNYMGSGSFDRDPLADLVISAQYDRTTGEGKPYGWRTEYRDVYAVELERAGDMHKLLRKVDRGLEKLRGEWGYPETFAQYATRVAKVLGISTFGYRRKGAAGTYDDNEYRWTDTDGLRYRINELVDAHDKANERVAA